MVVAAFTVVNIFWRGWFLGEPVAFIALGVLILVGMVAQVASVVIYLLAVKPRMRARDAYAVTDRRVLMTTGLRRRYTWSAYLDQVSEPRLQRPVLHDVPAAGQAREIIVQARQRVLERQAGAQPPAVSDVSVPLPAAVTPGAERVLWTGRAGRMPVWFGAQDACISALGLFMLCFVGCIAGLSSAAAWYRRCPPRTCHGDHLLHSGWQIARPPHEDQAVDVRAHRPKADHQLAATAAGRG